MHPNMTKIVLALLGLIVLAAPKAVQAQDSDYQWSTNADEASVTIVLYKGSGGNVVIPDTLAGLTVTSIGSRAFEQTNVTSVTIPQSVTSLGSYAFFACNILTNVSIPGSLAGIGDSAFEYCISLGNIVIPAGVSNIGEMAFSYCTSLTNVTVGDTVRSIGTAAFFQCGTLATVNIPDSVTNLGETAFLNCTSLGSISVPGSVGSISFEAFETCGLTNVILGNGITNIGPGAFYFCDNLGSISIPNGVTTIGVQAFDACASLTSLLIPASVTNIGDNAFTDCTSLSNLYFQGNAPTPGNSVFLFDNYAKAYYLPDTLGWKSTYAGIPAELTPVYTVHVTAIPSSAHAIVGGAGRYYRGTDLTVTASFTNECYNFLGWSYAGKIVSTNLQYAFTLLKSESLLAEFSLQDYEITTSVEPSNAWGVAVGGGKKACGSSATLRAVARGGFDFTGWTTSLGTTITNAVYKFVVGESEDFVAHFKDVELPKVNITTPSNNEKISATNFTIKGTASDNASVMAVYYNLNDTGWQLASPNKDNFDSWSANVTLAANSTNTVSAYAVDSSTNFSPIKGPIKFIVR
jgi:hypothetical protein